MFWVIKGELEIGARWRLRMTSLENQNNAIFPFPRYYRIGVYTLYGQDSGNNSEVDMELSIFVS